MFAKTNWSWDGRPSVWGILFTANRGRRWASPTSYAIAGCCGRPASQPGQHDPDQMQGRLPSCAASTACVCSPVPRGVAEGPPSHRVLVCLLRPVCLPCGVVCQGLVLFWEDTDEILQVQCGPFPKGTVVRIQSLQNDPMQLSGKVGTIAWLVPGGAAVTIDGIQDAVKVQDAAMTKELGVHCELVGEKVGVHMSSPPSAALSVRNMLSTVQPRRLGMLKHGQALCVMRVGGWVMLCACAALLDASGETLQIQATDPQMIFRYWLNPAA